jgi:hypothetical protein
MQALFTVRRVYETSTVNFELDEFSAYAQLETLDKSIALLMEQIGVCKGDNVPIDSCTLFKSTSGI